MGSSKKESIRKEWLEAFGAVLLVMGVMMIGMGVWLTVEESILKPVGHGFWVPTLYSSK